MSKISSILSLTLFFYAINRLVPSLLFQGHCHFAAEASEMDSMKHDDDNATRKEVPLYKQRDPECFDRSPHCPQWARALECRKKNGKAYMKENCRYSCNLCNPLLQPWTPAEAHETEVSYRNQEEIGFTIFAGVEQKIDFSDSPMHKYGTVNIHPALSEHKYIKSRVTTILKSQQDYLDIMYADIEINENQYVSSIDPDLDNVNRFTLSETCVNYHPYCANWAARGMCELKPSAMTDVCSPVCQMCDHVLSGQQVAIEPRTNYWFPSPFKRDDLFGIFNSIQENRIAIDWSDDTNVNRLSGVHLDDYRHDGDRINILRTNGIIKTLYVWERSDIHAAFLLNAMKGNTNAGFPMDGIDEQHTIVMDSFVTAEECKSILDAVKFGIGLDTNSAIINRGDDGFSETTSIGRKLKVQSAYIDDIARSSSEIFLYPTLKDGERLKFAPSVERLLKKMSLMSGIPVEHVEVPIKIEKFPRNGFRRASSHFKDAVVTSEGSRYFNSNVQPGDEFDSASDILKTDIMNNARVLGFTLFLSDVEEGGAVTFPFLNVEKIIRVEPKIGRAILFPTVVNLVGMYDSRVEPIDGMFDNDGATESFLFEDRASSIQHEKVERGTKYSVTIYFRRFENQEEDLLYQ